MVRLHAIPKWLIGICLLAASGILLGCDADFDDGCGGVGDLVSCLSIDNIQPTNIADSASSNVDAFASLCPDGSGEPFGDHSAAVTFTNSRYPNVDGTPQATAQGSQRIVITSYSVTYTLNRCPAAAAGCPALTGFTITGDTTTIPPNTTLTASFKFVPLAVKEEYVAEGGELGAGSGFGAPLPSYSANYVFSVRTEPFTDSFTVRGAAEFTIGAFNLCGA